MRSNDFAVRAYAIADTLPLQSFVSSAFPNVEADVRKTVAVVPYRDGAWAVLHDFGALVFVGAPDEERERVLAELDRAGKTSQADAAERYCIRVNPDATPKVTFDALSVRELTRDAVELVALVVGQSVAMEYYEADIDKTLLELDAHAVTLEQHGRFRGRLRALVRGIGKGMHLRNRVVSTLALLDEPDATWDNEAHDQLYRELRRTFSIEDRYRALDYKLSIIRDNLELIVDLVRHDRSIVLEAAVFLLIALEVILAFVRH